MEGILYIILGIIALGLPLGLGYGLGKASQEASLRALERQLSAYDRAVSTMLKLWREELDSLQVERAKEQTRLESQSEMIERLKAILPQGETAIQAKMSLLQAKINEVERLLRQQILGDLS